jgi:hypothetical protein
MYFDDLNLTIYTYQSLSQNNVWTPLHIFSEHICKCSRTEYCALLHCKPCKPRNGCVWEMNVNWSGIVHISELSWKDCLICSCFVELGAFHLNGLTSQTRILNYGKIWSIFLKFLGKMDIILMLSKFSDQIGTNPECFVFHSTIWPFWLVGPC